jgi:hypothetical protein
MSLCPASPSLPWVPWVAVPHLPRDSAPRRRPPAPRGSLRLSLASRYRACFMVFVVSPRAHGLLDAPRSRQGLWSPGPPCRALCTEIGGSPTFPSSPSEDRPRSQTPVVSCALAAVAPRMVAFRRMHTVGFGLDAAEAILLTTTLHIAGLNNAACLLAPSSFARPLLDWHVEFTTARLARL